MHLRIKTAAGIMISLLLWASAATAETKYVIDRLEITLRSGPAMANRIIAMIPSGRALEVLSTSGDWVEVKLPGGDQGWVMGRYLSSEIPKSAQFEHLTQKYEALVGQKDSLGSSASELAKEKERLTAELAQVQTQLAQLTTAHETLKSESADFIGMKNKYETTLKELEETRVKAESAENELNKLSNNQIYQGMLYGGGLLALGFIVGLVTRRSKRKSGLY
jgi:SH3 domain protein